MNYFHQHTKLHKIQLHKTQCLAQGINTGSDIQVSYVTFSDWKNSEKKLSWCMFLLVGQNSRLHNKHLYGSHTLRYPTLFLSKYRYAWSNSWSTTRTFFTLRSSTFSTCQNQITIFRSALSHKPCRQMLFITIFKYFRFLHQCSNLGNH